MSWRLTVAKRAQKKLARFPPRDQDRIAHALDDMTIDPLRGDVVQLKTEPIRFRRRVGAYRIFFRLDVDGRAVNVTEIDRRTTTTYRHRR